LVVAVQHVGVAPTSLVIGMVPVLVTLVGAREHNAIELKRLAWPLVAIVLGAICISYDVLANDLSAELAQSLGSKIWGLGAAIAALIVWSLYAIGNARHLQQRPDLSSHDWSLLTGLLTGVMALLLAIGYYAADRQAASEKLSTTFVVLMLLLAVGPSVLGTGLWNAATRRLPLTLGGQLLIFETVFALLYGFFYEARWPRPMESLAIVLLLGGVLASSWVHAGEAVEKPAS
jgi:drug/metabolite transporter (DMT)-like permease